MSSRSVCGGLGIRRKPVLHRDVVDGAYGVQLDCPLLLDPKICRCHIVCLRMAVVNDDPSVLFEHFLKELAVSARNLLSLEPILQAIARL